MKFDSDNYILWRIQLENALLSNDLLGYIQSPPDKVLNSTGQEVDNAEFAVRKLINGQLLSCITATIYVSTLPHVLGLAHSYQVCHALESRFSSLTRSHVHDLKRKLYNLKKTTTMDKYIDQVKEYSQKLAAAGSSMEDEDIVFHTWEWLQYTPQKWCIWCAWYNITTIDRNIHHNRL